MTEDIPVIRLLAERRPDVLALAEVVSPAVYVEPALLRMARYTLLSPGGLGSRSRPVARPARHADPARPGADGPRAVIAPGPAGH